MLQKNILSSKLLLTKVCGMTQVEQVHELIGLKIDFCGFIFYAKSPRYVLQFLQESEIKAIPNSIQKIGVFVNETESQILHLVESCGLNGVQLHGDESSEFCKKLRQSIFTIKVIRVNAKDDLQQKVDEYENSVDCFLFDTDSKGYGGTGIKFDWEILKNLKLKTKYFLSGGISPLDLGVLRLFATENENNSPFAIDINSKFEKKYGIKDIKMIKNFVIDMNSEF